MMTHRFRHANGKYYTGEVKLQTGSYLLVEFTNDNGQIDTYRCAKYVKADESS